MVIVSERLGNFQNFSAQPSSFCNDILNIVLFHFSEKSCIPL